MSTPTFRKGTTLYHPILGKLHYYGPHETLADEAYCTKSAERFRVQVALLSVIPWPKPVWNTSVPEGLYAVQVANTWAVRRATGEGWFMVDAKKQAVGPVLKEAVESYMLIE